MKRIIFFWLFCMTAVVAYSQTEICDDGKDNDGDGFIDCYDPDCSSFGKCNGTFLGNDATCEVKPSTFPSFAMAVDYVSEADATNNAARLAIGDLDKDGIPEIVTMNRYSNTITILSGTDASDPTKAKTKYQKNFSWSPQWEVAIGNINNDNCGEIFIWGDGGGVGKRVYKLDCQLNEIGKTSNDFPGDPINFGLADFNGDGKVELYVKDQIFDASTMTRLVDGGNWGNSAGAPVAVDIDGDKPGGDANLELVIGMKIFKVNLGGGAADGGSLSEIYAAPATEPQYFIKNAYNSSSVADLNQDGSLDIIASGADDKGVSTVFFYDVKNQKVKTFKDADANKAPYNFASDYLPNGWKNGTGRINIGDLDGNGILDLSYVTGKYLMALTLNAAGDLIYKWHLGVNEETSGYTGCTMFDFNGDGKSEIVYRDERKLYIINGDGTADAANSVACVSRTSSEYPFVADVDADGSTEICVPCIIGDPIIYNADGSNKSDFSSGDKYLKMSSEIRVYKSANKPWVPARRVWNQHAYFNVNINDDLTIPLIQQKHHLVFSTGDCTTGANRPLNTFLNQSPYLNSKGCPTYASPDLAHVPNSMVVVAPTCPATSFKVSFKITNLGDISLNGNVPISFYNGDPTKAGAIKLVTLNVGLTNFNTGDVLPINNATIPGPGSPFILYVVLNDAGKTATPITLPNTSFIECNYDNIISVPVRPLPVSIAAVPTDNIKCTGSTTPDVGTVSASVGATKNTTDYNFFWFKGSKTDIDATPDGVQPTYTGLPAGFYTVFAVHKTAKCSSDTVSVEVKETTRTVSVVIEPKGVTDCATNNGELKAVVNNGTEPVNNFTFKWYEGNLVGTPGTEARLTNIASNLKAITYTVLVTDNATGCRGIQSLKVPDNTIKPVVTATPTDILCSNLTSGSAKADVGGVTTGYTFDWYNGSNVKPLPDSPSPTPTYTNRAAGDYTVVATHTASNCKSDKVTVTIKQTTPPTVTASATAQQTSCDPARPNGAVTASATGGSGDFTTEWFKGQNTLPANKITATTGLAVGIYTVRMKDNVSGCSATAEATVTLQTPASPPVLTATPAPQTQCVPYNGSVTASIDTGNEANYTFFWYKGTSVKTTPDFTDTDNVLSGLEAGKYTVKAVNNLTHCVAASKTTTVIDSSPTISIVFDPVISSFPSNCNDETGIIKISVNSPGNTLGFKVEWFSGNAPFTTPFQTDNGLPGADGYYTSTNRKVGKYTVIATDLHSGCKATQIIDLPFAFSPELKYVSQNDILDCKPASRGDIEVDLFIDASKNPIGFVSSDFDIYVYQNESDPGDDQSEITPAAASPVFPYTTPTVLLPNHYTIVGVVNSSDPAKSSYVGCRINSVRAEILKTTTNPEIEFVSQTPNTNCTLPGNGTITVKTVNSPAITASFDWYSGPAVAGASIHTGATLTRNQGIYTVEATNTVTECKAEATYSIYDMPDLISIGTGLNITDITSCDTNGDLSTTDGGAEVTEINENATSVTSLAGYTFDWTALTTGTTLPSGNPLTGQAKGFYLLKATKANGCFTEKEFEIKDKTTGSPFLSFDSFENPELCVNPKDGFLKVSATATSGTLAYEWTNSAGTVVGGNSDTFVVTRPASPAPSAPAPATMEFSIKVSNTVTNCFVTDTYRIPVDVNKVLLLASAASPVTNCITNNGAVFATVTNDVPTEYSYNWSTGDNTNLVENLAMGSYTVTATDLLDSYCVSAPQTVVIGDMRVTPAVVAASSAPLTNCDPIKANGVANASVSNNVINYIFDWYAGATATGTPIATGYEVGGLLDQTYTVVATDRVTGCTGSTQVTVMKNALAIPNPTIVVLSNVTSCIDDNGSMSASVGGNTNDYIFDWSVGSAPKTPIDYHDQITIDSLSIGLYTVIATSRITGCVSGPDTDQIIEEKLQPEFDFSVTAASCEAANGSASLNVLNNASVASVEWNIDGEIRTGFIIDQIKAGTYDIVVTTDMGCSLEKTITITTDIRPFNGVSRNGDGKNDTFYINCIDNFPGNNVKIFNRAGTKVYEDDNYDNIDIYFDGKSNKGVSPMGVNLPDGTYYYIIDKRDGSKPIAGYLELVN